MQIGVRAITVKILPVSFAGGRDHIRVSISVTSVNRSAPRSADARQPLQQLGRRPRERFDRSCFSFPFHAVTVCFLFVASDVALFDDLQLGSPDRELKSQNPRARSRKIVLEKRRKITGRSQARKAYISCLCVEKNGPYRMQQFTQQS